MIHFVQVIFCRWGGEEFLVILDQTDLNTALPIAEKLRNRTYEYDFGLNRPITLSIGISQANPDIPIGNTIKSADTAMYKAKNHKSKSECFGRILMGKHICSDQIILPFFISKVTWELREKNSHLIRENGLKVLENR